MEAQSVHTAGQDGLQTGQYAEHGNDVRFCGTDIGSESARLAHDAYLLARKNGLLPARKKSSPPEIGESREFRIDQAVGQTKPWTLAEFTLIDKVDGLYYMWVKTDEAQQLSPSERNALRQALAFNTPNGSLDPNRGIMANDEAIFGSPPNVDGDGVTDILLYALDGLGGYVSSEDLSPAMPDTIGNHADVIHVSVTESISWMTGVMAHEYTHLLHFTSGWDWGYTFNTEGYAEYAEVLNGYLVRGINYMYYKYEDEFGHPVDYEYTLPLFNWRFTPTNGGPDSRDYQRGGLFFTYIANREGPEAVGGMAKGEIKGPSGIDSVLVEVGSSLNEIVRDFHTANFVNDASLDSRFGYVRPGRTQFHAAIDPPIDGERMYNGPEGPEYRTIKDDRDITQGSVRYFQWKDVANVQLLIDSAGYQGIPNETARERERLFQEGNMLIRVAGQHPDGSVLIQDVDASPAYQSIPGRFSYFTVQVSHTASTNGRYNLETYWTPLSKVTGTNEMAAVPSTTVLFQNYPEPFNPTTIIGFDLARPGRARLSVYDLLGRRIAVLMDGVREAGTHQVAFDASRLASGVYVYRLEADGRVMTRSMHVVR